MVEIDSDALIVAIQAVETTIKVQEKMLEAEVLGDRSDCEEYLLTLEKVKGRLRDAYQQASKDELDLPPYEELLEIRLV